MLRVPASLVAIFVLSKNRLDVRHYSWIAIIIIPISWF